MALRVEAGMTGWFRAWMADLALTWLSRSTSCRSPARATACRPSWARTPWPGRASPLAQVTVVVHPFHIVRPGQHGATRCRRRVQQEIMAHRGWKGDPRYDTRKLLLLGAERLDETGRRRIHDAGDANEAGRFRRVTTIVAGQLGGGGQGGVRRRPVHLALAGPFAGGEGAEHHSLQGGGVVGQAHGALRAPGGQPVGGHHRARCGDRPPQAPAHLEAAPAAAQRRPGAYGRATPGAGVGHGGGRPSTLARASSGDAALAVRHQRGVKVVDGFFNHALAVAVAGPAQVRSAY